MISFPIAALALVLLTILTIILLITAVISCPLLACPGLWPVPELLSPLFKKHCFPMYNVHNVQCTLHSVQCTMRWSLLCTKSIVSQCTLCTMHNVQWAGLPLYKKDCFPMYTMYTMYTMYNGLISPLYKRHHPISFQASHYQINCPNLHTQFVTSHSERLQIFEMLPTLSFWYGYEKWHKRTWNRRNESSKTMAWRKMGGRKSANIEAHINNLTGARRATAGQPLSSKDRMHAAAAGRASEPSVGFGGNLLVPSWSSF